MEHSTVRSFDVFSITAFEINSIDNKRKLNEETLTELQDIL